MQNSHCTHIIRAMWEEYVVNTSVENGTYMVHNYTCRATRDTSVCAKETELYSASYYYKTMHQTHTMLSVIAEKLVTTI